MPNTDVPTRDTSTGCSDWRNLTTVDTLLADASEYWRVVFNLGSLLRVTQQLATQTARCYTGLENHQLLEAFNRQNGKNHPEETAQSR